MFLLITQPLLLTFLMDFFEPCSTMPIWHAWLLAIACVLTAICTSVLIQHVNYEFYLKKNIQSYYFSIFIVFKWLVYKCVLLIVV